jgi:hypothetical protein
MRGTADSDIPSATASAPLDGLNAGQLELVLQNLQAEKSCRLAERSAKGEIIYLN